MSVWTDRVAELVAEGKARKEAERIATAEILASVERDAKAEAAAAPPLEDRPLDLAGEVISEGDGEATLNTEQGHDDPEIAALFGGD